MSKTFFITGGGTGGHIYPAIAVADEILKKIPDSKIYYVGNPQNLEATIVKDKPYIFLPVRSSGMPRKISFSFIKWTLKMFFAWLKSCYYIAKYKPIAVFGTGGYVSAPALFAAITTRTPFVMHDCDANPGLVTRKLAPFAKSISIAFEQARKKLNNKNCRLNGNPIRSEFSTLSKPQARTMLNLDERLTLCIMGGSQGAKTINSAMLPLLNTLTKDYNIQIIFQTGKKNYEETVSKLKEIYPDFESDKNIILRSYFDNMVPILKASDIAISRAGSLSISELCASAVATIFVPYPYAAADHQRKNAKVMAECGAGLYLEDSDTTSQNILNLLKKLLEDEIFLKNMQEKSLSLAKFDATDKIVEQILE